MKVIRINATLLLLEGLVVLTLSLWWGLTKPEDAVMRVGSLRFSRETALGMLWWVGALSVLAGATGFIVVRVSEWLQRRQKHRPTWDARTSKSTSSIQTGSVSGGPEDLPVPPTDGSGCDDNEDTILASVVESERDNNSPEEARVLRGKPPVLHRGEPVQARSPEFGQTSVAAEPKAPSETIEELAPVTDSPPLPSGLAETASEVAPSSHPEHMYPRTLRRTPVNRQARQPRPAKRSSYLATGMLALAAVGGIAFAAGTWMGAHFDWFASERPKSTPGYVYKPDPFAFDRLTASTAMGKADELFKQGKWDEASTQFAIAASSSFKAGDTELAQENYYNAAVSCSNAKSWSLCQRYADRAASMQGYLTEKAGQLASDAVAAPYAEWQKQTAESGQQTREPWMDKANWAKLQEGMTSDQVEAILGKPRAVYRYDALGTLYYYYGLYHVEFGSGYSDRYFRVKGWSGPP